LTAAAHKESNMKPLELTAYHGTIQPNVSLVRQQGLRSYRRSGRVYVAFDFNRAATYACCWAVGLHVAGDIDRPIAAVITVHLPADQPTVSHQVDEAAIDGGLPPEAIGDVELIDCAQFDEVTRIGFAMKLLGIIGFDHDPPRRRRWQAEAKRIRAYLAQFPPEVIRDGFDRTPMI
jgi:hypothetical protein